LWNGCGSEAGKSERKRTVELSTGTWKEGTGNQAGEKGETGEARAETGTGEAAVRRNREGKERKNRGLVVRTRNRDGRKEVKTEGVRKRKGSSESCGMDGPEKVGNESGRQG